MNGICLLSATKVMNIERSSQLLLIATVTSTVISFPIIEPYEHLIEPLIGIWIHG